MLTNQQRQQTIEQVYVLNQGRIFKLMTYEHVSSTTNLFNVLSNHALGPDEPGEAEFLNAVPLQLH